MRKITPLSVIAILVIFSLPVVAQTKAFEGPVPPQVVSARKIFISNAGTDAEGVAVFKRAGEPQQVYNHFYSAMQAWGHYELVPSPADAELVFEIRFSAPVAFNGNLPISEPLIDLRIVDAKSHFILWYLGAPVHGAFRKTTWFKNFDASIQELMTNLKVLTEPASQTPAEKKP